MTPELALQLTRRELFKRSTFGLGTIALTSLLTNDRSVAHPLADAGSDSQIPFLRAKARNVILLHMVGAPSQLELFDNKPVLQQYDGELVPESLIKGQRFAFLRGRPRLMGARVGFSRRGASGLELSDLLPHLGSVADHIAPIKTLQTEEFNHGPAQLFLHTGAGEFGRPSLGAWVSYGLGTENRDLPAFVVLVTGSTPGAGNSVWGNGFLPSVHQGVQFRSSGDPVLFLSNPPGLARSGRRRIVDTIKSLNETRLADVGDPEIATRIAQYELAFRMQTAVPDLMDISQEPKSIHEMYGTTPGKPSFANHCLLARRLVEKGVRFVQLCDSGWDHHGSIVRGLRRKCTQVDQPCAALIRDLKQRGLLDDTLVVWSAEFGRTPMLQGDQGERAGRDHHKDAFCAWLAGGGIRGGRAYGQTDELGYLPVEGRTHIRDLHATILHLLGVDHEKLTYKYQGREFRLTDIGGEVIHEILT